MCLKPSKSKNSTATFFKVTPRQENRLVNAVVEEHSIGQTGQKVVVGRMGHLHRHRPGCAHVAENDYRSVSMPFTVPDTARKAERRKPVAARRFCWEGT